MLFDTVEFFVFLAVVLALYYALAHRWQNRMLLVASYLFYAAWDYRFLSLLFISTTVDFFAGRAMDRTDKPERRRAFLALSLVVNLGILGFFKYFNFFADNLNHTLALVGLHSSLPVLNIILPVGVSFYTFQEMSYTLDIYRGKMKPVENFWDFALNVCYFPHLVAGPIQRANSLLKQIQSRRVVTRELFLSGCVLILIGLFRKVVIADGVAPEVDQIFAQPHLLSSPELLKGIYLFAIQIYCDFAGYSDIARGVSRLLGIELMENFNHPYFSANISEFWRRWHISLSTWLRDYLYISLGGNRGSRWSVYRNLMVTMLLGGLWHGANWTFVIWGGLHGLYLAVYRFLRGDKSNRVLPATTGWNAGRVLGVFITFHLVLLTWVFFRAPGIRVAIDYLRGIFALRGMEALPGVLPAIVLPYLLVLLVDIPQFLSSDQTVLRQWPVRVRNGAVAAMLFLVLLGFGSHVPFIYFQF